MTASKDGLGGLSAINFTNLRDQVVQVLRENIILAQLEPGSVLGETRLAKTLNVSRGTVREAILELEKESLVDTDEAGRHYIINLTSKTVADVFQVRASLESLAASIIHQSAQRGEKQAVLRKLLDNFQQFDESALLEVMDYDLKFHRTLCQLSDNNYLVDSWRRIEGPLRVAIVYGGSKLARHNMTKKEHEPFVSALDADQRDPAGLVYNTLMDTARGLISSYENPLQSDTITVAGKRK